MANEITPYLGLILSSDLTRESKINLRKIDALGEIFFISSAGVSSVRAQGDVRIVSDASELGGAGNGPTMLFDVSENSIVFASQTPGLIIDFGGATASNVTIDWSDIDFASSTVLDIVDYVTETQSQINSNANVIAAAAHIPLTNNPHSVTAAQVDAYTIGQVDTLLNAYATLSDLNDHETDYTNPHQVTAAQTGAYQTTQVDALLLLKANKTTVDSHIADTSVHGVSGDVVGTTDSQELTNKTINASSNTISNIVNANIKSDAAIDGTKISPDFGSQIVKTQGSFRLSNGTYTTDIRIAASGQTANQTFYFPAEDGSSGQVLATDGAGNWVWASVMTSVLAENSIRVGDSGGAVAVVDTSSVGDVLADSVTGLTIKSGAIVNADINASAAIDASKIANGNVSNTEFQYLDGVTSAIQTQINEAVDFPNDGVATTITTQDQYLNFTGTSGCISGYAITKNVAAGTIDIAEGEFILRDNATPGADSELKLWKVPAKAGLAITDDVINLVYADYNGGSPEYFVTTDFSQINTTTKILFANVFRNGTNYMDAYTAQCPTLDGIGSISTVEALTRPVKRATGSILSSPSGLDIKVTAGLLYSVFSPATVPEIDTTGAGTFTSIYKNGASTWSRTTGVSAVDSANYNNGTSLTALSPGRYAVRYFYWFFDDPARLIMLYGGAQYTTIAAAEAAAKTTRADLPPELQTSLNSFLIGAVIVQEGSSTIIDVLNVTTTAFTSTTATTHNNLAGLNDGDYKHLTAANWTKLVNNTLTADKAMITDASGYIATSATSSTEIGYLQGASSNIQNQIDALVAINTDTLEPTGFVNRTDSTLAFDNGTRTVTIAPAVTDFDFYIQGTKYTKNSAQTVVIPDVTDTYYVYFDMAGVLQYSDSVPNFTETAFAVLLYWNAATGDWFLGEERHGITMDGATHGYLHNTRGAAYATGLAISGYAPGSATPEDVDFAISAGAFYDEDIRNTPTGHTEGTNWHKWYRSGVTGEWRKDTATTLPYLYNAGVGPYINTDPGAGWQLTAVSNNAYFNLYVIATNEADTEGLITLPGQAEYASSAAAQAAGIGNLELGSLPTPETVPLYQITCQYKTTYTANDARVEIIAVKDLRSTSSLGVTASPASQHNGLAGLQGGAAGEYYHLTTAQHTSLTGNLRYFGTFDATTSWGSAVSGKYTIVITAATHGLTNPASVCVYENAAGERAYIDTLIDPATKDVALVVEEAPDMRFAGNYIIV